MLAICVNIEQVKNVIFLSLLTFQFKQRVIYCWKLKESQFYTFKSIYICIFKTFFFPFRPIVSERNELLIQFLSDLSLTADGFIGHYKFRPKKLPTTTALPVTTTFPVSTTSKSALKFLLRLEYKKNSSEVGVGGRGETD